jgi:CRISPR-associated protein Csd1
MILQALKEYYDRLAADPESGIAPEGWIQGGIDFLIELDVDGKFLGIQSLQEQNGKKKVPKPMLVPNIGKQASKHTMNGKDANLLWDNASFVLGLGDKGDLRLGSMIQAIDDWVGQGIDPGVDAVRAFLSQGLSNREHFSAILGEKEYGEQLATGSPKVSFHIQGSRHMIVFDAENVKKCLSTVSSMTSGDENSHGQCLISGEENALLEPTHPVIKGVWGTQTAGGSLVSFNAPAFRSFSKEQSYNAPVSKKAASEYTKSLNTLLASAQRLQIGDASTVFWSEKKTHFESDFASFFSEPPKDDPSAGTRKLKNLLDSPKTGSYLEDKGDTEFYILGLSPNAGRISVRFWEIGTISSYAERIRQHFEDLAIVKPPSEPEYYSLWRLLVNVAIQDKSENIPPNIAGDFMRSIMDGAPYPQTILQQAIRRIHSDTEKRVKPVRAALIKAYLNRYLRAHPNSKEKEIMMALDTEQPSTGYQLGRLFAVLEKIQEEANPGLNATIRERYYGAACSSPVTVFGTLLRLKNHHLPKIENKGRVTNLERLVGEIVSHIDDFPPHLSLHEQGKFAIGYYHQRQDLFTKKES